MAESIAQGTAFDGNDNRHLLRFLQAYRSGWKQTIKLPSLLVLVYLLQLFFAILITFPLQTILANTQDRVGFLAKPISEFDFVLFSDFLNQHGDLLRGRLDQSMMMMGLFLVFYVFITGGILETLIHRRDVFSGSEFWKGAGKYLGKLIACLFLFGSIQGVILLLFIGMLILNGINPFTMESDQQVVRMVQWLFPAFLILEVIVSMVHDHVKVGIVQHPESSFIQVIRERSRQVFRSFFPAFGLYLVVIVTGQLIFFTGRSISGLLPENTLSGIWVALLISQVFILGRIAMKIVNYASIHAFYIEQGAQTDPE